MPIETVTLETVDAVTLEGDLAIAGADRPAALVAHPHPLYGGDRHNAVVAAIFDALRRARITALRFDFRREHDDGQAERLDVVAAIDAVAPFAGDAPIVAIGYSFGARVVLDVLDARLDGWVGVAAPFRPDTTPLAGSDHRPKLLIVPGHDQFCPPELATKLTTPWSRTTLDVVPTADHFLNGHLSVVADRAVAFVEGLSRDGR